MLWIEHESEGKLGISTIREILNSLAEIVAPFPVCSYDRGEFGVGLVVHDGVESSSLKLSDTPSSRSDPSTLVDHVSSPSHDSLIETLSKDTDGGGSLNLSSDSSPSSSAPGNS